MHVWIHRNLNRDLTTIKISYYSTTHVWHKQWNVKIKLSIYYRDCLTERKTEINNDWIQTWLKSKHIAIVININKEMPKSNIKFIPIQNKSVIVHVCFVLFIVCLYICVCKCLLQNNNHKQNIKIILIDDDDCFYYHSWRNNVVIAFGTLSSFLT